MPTKKSETQRARILEAALTVLRRDGMPGLTQPKVATAARMRQSHLTYYFPTRRDLVAAIAALLAEGLLAGFGAALAGETQDAAVLAARLARISTAEQTRLLLTLVLAADQEASIRTLFRRLTKEARQRLAQGLSQHGLPDDSDSVALIHALGVGLAVLDLARRDPASRRELRSVMALALANLDNKGRKS